MTAAYPVAQRMGFAVLTAVFPPDLVDEVVDRVGKREQRDRLLPARLTVYFTLALWLFVSSNYEYVIDRLMDGLAWARRSLGERPAPRASSLARARDRLGPDVLRVLFEEVKGPIGTVDTPGVFWRNHRIVALDEATLSAPDTPDNQQAWGTPASTTLTPAPRVRLLALAESGTRSVMAATFGPSTMPESDLAVRLLRHLGPGMVLLADPELFGAELWQAASRTGTHLVWRLPRTVAPPPYRALADGTYLSTLPATSTPLGTADDAPLIRVIDDTLPDEAHEPRRLATTLLGPEQAPALEVAQLYRGRWKLTTAIDTFKGEPYHEPDLALRSRSAEGVSQEIWAMFCVYQALHRLNLLDPTTRPGLTTPEARRRMDTDSRPLTGRSTRI